jgi:hypothetical protein
MKFLENLKLDKWYTLVLYLGVFFIVASLYFAIDFLKEKYLFGLGAGMVMVGLSFFIAEKTLSTIKSPNAYTGGPTWISWKEIRHNFFSVALLIIGLFLICIFGFLIIKSLI